MVTTYYHSVYKRNWSEWQMINEKSLHHYCAMEFQSLLLAIFLLLLPLLIVAKGLIRKSHQTRRNLPPGTTGLPFIGESLDFFRANKTGEQNNFVAKRVLKYGSHTFRTSLFGSEMVVMCGAAANKFLFSNEGKKVALWWPESAQRMIGTSLVTKFGKEGRSDKKMMMHFFSPETLTRWVSTVDDITHRHISSHWEGKEEVAVNPAMKAYTFEIACWLLMSITEPELLSRLAFHFNVFVKGLLSLPLNLPGTRFYKAMKAADTIRKEIRVLLRERSVGMEKKVNGASSMEDLMSYLMLKTNGDGRLMPEEEIINNLLDLLFAGHDTSSCVLTLVFKYLAELPHVHQKVLAEQMAIAEAKKGELLQWEDLQKMKYTWSVVCEIMRMTPPATGAYREALEDFTFEGYTIPKGSKIFWSASFTHKDSNYEKPTTFDETRFEGSGPPPFSYVPFGGGPRVCLGKEFARLEILIFIHNFICKFDWDLAIPNERVVIDPFPVPVNGLPVRPRPRHLSC